jgi:hypothetical protein
MSLYATFSEIVYNLLTLNISVVLANYIESTLSSFTPKSWYGWVAPFSYTAVSLLVSCNIKCYRFNAIGKMVVEQAASFFLHFLWKLHPRSEL